jgi:NADPH:quinone reductase-like Zn-dependent oxidoreductase
VKAFILDRYGSADHVRAGEAPDPELRDDDVLVQVHAAGVNLLDSKIRNGEFKRLLTYRLPLVLGHDVAGVVVRVGSRVRRFKPGGHGLCRSRTRERQGRRLTQVERGGRALLCGRSRTTSDIIGW